MNPNSTYSTFLLTNDIENSLSVEVSLLGSSNPESENFYSFSQIDFKELKFKVIFINIIFDWQVYEVVKFYFNS